MAHLLNVLKGAKWPSLSITNGFKKSENPRPPECHDPGIDCRVHGMHWMGKMISIVTEYSQRNRLRVKFQYEDPLSRYRNPHYKETMGVKQFHLYNGNSFTSKTSYLYWNVPQVISLYFTSCINCLCWVPCDDFTHNLQGCFTGTKVIIQSQLIHCIYF